MKKVINIAYLTKDLNINGISTVILNYCKNIDKNKFKITIFTGAPINSFYVSEFSKLNIEIIELPPKTSNVFKYYLILFKKLNVIKYDIVHIHGNSATITMELLLSYLCKIKVRIAHSHNSTCNHIKIHKFMLPLFNRLYTHAFACSNLAGRWLFGANDFYVIPNGFDVNKFKFNLSSRTLIRKSLNLSNEFLIGHIGRFNDQKNHIFLLKVFEKIALKSSNAHLILVGAGPDFEIINNIIDKHPYKDRIIVYGETNTIEDIYSAIDYFVFPSKYEGLGIVALEAQISGLYCCVSNFVPKDIVITDRVDFLSIETKDIDNWALTILNNYDNNFDRSNCFRQYYDKIINYDIMKNVKQLENLYCQFTRI